jgi:hypothetical protein
MPEITPFTTPITEIKANTQMPSGTMKMPVAPTNTTEPPKQDLQNEPPKEVKKEEVDPRFIAMARKEKELRALDLKIKAQQQELETKYKSAQELLELKEKDKFAAAEKLGLTYEEWTNHQLGEMNLTPEQIAERKAIEIVKKELEQERALRKQEEEQRFQQTYQQALKDISQEAKKFATESQEFPLVKTTESFDTITSLIEQTYQTTGKLIPVEEATKMVEKSFREDLDELYKLLNPPKEELKPQPATQAPQLKPQQQTLTHKTTVSPSPTAPDFKSWQDRKQYLIQKYGGR